MFQEKLISQGFSQEQVDFAVSETKSGIGAIILANAMYRKYGMNQIRSQHLIETVRANVQAEAKVTLLENDSQNNRSFNPNILDADMTRLQPTYQEEATSNHNSGHRLGGIIGAICFFCMAWAGTLFPGNSTLITIFLVAGIIQLVWSLSRR